MAALDAPVEPPPNAPPQGADGAPGKDEFGIVFTIRGAVLAAPALGAPTGAMVPVALATTGLVGSATVLVNPG
jgi:hypothetical protein